MVHLGLISGRLREIRLLPPVCCLAVSNNLHSYRSLARNLRLFLPCLEV